MTLYHLVLRFSFSNMQFAGLQRKRSSHHRLFINFFYYDTKVVQVFRVSQGFLKGDCPLITTFILVLKLVCMYTNAFAEHYIPRHNQQMYTTQPAFTCSS